MHSLFLRIETYPVRRIPFLFAEVRREPWACMHVRAPAVPTVPFGEQNLVQLEHEIYEQAATAREVTKRGVGRGIRASQHIVAFATASFPFRCDDVREDSVLQEMLNHWIALNLDFAEMQWNEQVASAVLHLDETYPHLHIILVPNNEQMLARPLHPGYSAQRKTDTDARSAGASLGEAHAAGRNAYKDAMRRFLDQYHESVGTVLDFARRGIGAKRLPRAVSQALKDASKIQTELAAEKRRLEAEIDDFTLARSEIEISTKAVVSDAQRQAAGIIRAAAAEADAARRGIEDEKKANEAAKIALEERAARQTKRFADAARTLNIGFSQIASGKVGVVDGQLGWPPDVASTLKHYEHLLMPLATRVAAYENKARKILTDAERLLDAEQCTKLRAGLAAQFPRPFQGP